MKLLTTIKTSLKSIKMLLSRTRPEKSPKEKLNEIDCLICDSTALNHISVAQISNYFQLPSINVQWDSFSQTIEALNLPEMTGGVNPGDQRAIFYLISALKPQSTLEVGTHIGCSTVHISLALKPLINKTFTTVDIRDVNDAETQPWKEFNSPASPAQLIQKIGSQDFTQFKTSTSLDFFKQSDQKFDFIFLDGLHDAYMVYQEIPVALQHLNENGVILLHDYFPNGEPLWEGYPPIVGPYLAVKRLQEEGANLRVIPLGKLPWETKLGTNITSLAILTKN